MSTYINDLLTIRGRMPITSCCCWWSSWQRDGSIRISHEDAWTLVAVTNFASADTPDKHDAGVAGI